MEKKRFWVLIGLIGFLGLWASEAQAQMETGPLRKLGRGVANVFTGWLEVPAQVGKTMEQSGSWAGASVGLARGFAFGIGRTFVGVLETVTFPIPNPTTGYQPVIEPEFVTFRDADRW